MQVKVQMFAVLRDITGTESLALELPAGARAIDIWNMLRERHPQLAPMAEPPMTAVNEEYAAHDSLLQDGDRIAFIPPVSGG